MQDYTNGMNTILEYEASLSFVSSVITKHQRMEICQPKVMP
jgi:hypothetical protein